MKLPCVRPGWLLVLAACALPAFAADGLSHDPFVRPPLTAPGAPLQNQAGGKRLAGPEAPWNPKLTAVMVAGKDSLVDIDGRIINIGEEIDGYYLIKVMEGEAVFRKKNRRVVLKVRPGEPAKGN